MGSVCGIWSGVTMDNRKTATRAGKIKRIVLAVCIAGIVYFVAKSIEPRRVEVDGGERILMGTFARVEAVAGGRQTARSAIEAAFEKLEWIDDLMSDYKDDSELSRVNRLAYGRAVPVSSELFEVLAASVEYSRRTDGAFDVTVGPLVDLWRRAAEANEAPGTEQIAGAEAKVGYKKLLLDANLMSVRFAVDGMRLDLGGIAKGYAIDRAVEAMKTAGASGGMVDVGGDIRCFGRPADRAKWLVGLQDPESADSGQWTAYSGEEQTGGPAEMLSPGEVLMVLRLEDAAVATSGDYRRFEMIGGKRYSHIIDTKKGEGADKLSSVTIIAETATDADALATAVSVMGAEKGMALIEKKEGVEAILISAEGKVENSSGAVGYIEARTWQAVSDR